VQKLMRSPKPLAPAFCYFSRVCVGESLQHSVEGCTYLTAFPIEGRDESRTFAILWCLVSRQAPIFRHRNDCFSELNGNPITMHFGPIYVTIKRR
jgi:hypothetical protein